LSSSASTTYLMEHDDLRKPPTPWDLTVRDATGATRHREPTVTVANGRRHADGRDHTAQSGRDGERHGVGTIWVDGAAAGTRTYTMTVGGRPGLEREQRRSPATLPWVTTNGTNGTKTLVVTCARQRGAATGRPA